ncbi:uncharacterized protein LOC122365767 isoform X4 [Amphibalanus amphitrite]|uniref:uncharacterized protein LOC122365767 isoform X4 n=1 Tax=Amphibalanus amphitrite TaxID=1232801 RepID=UPI001C90BDFB|nr:uncharacterized protein LOC122365767 isoform X4 [Amphibalanus amphitrite]
MPELPSERKKRGMPLHQVSIESPGPTMKGCVFNFDVPMPEVPPSGARIRVMCAGVCYRSKRSMSINSGASLSSIGSDHSSCSNKGVRDTSLFPGFEVAGQIESFGENVDPKCGLKVGDNVIVYPYIGCPEGYAEYVAVEDVQYLVKVPDEVPMPVASMLPSGGLWAMNSVFTARQYVEKLLKERGDKGKVNVLVVGTGGLALWAIRIGRHYFPEWTEGQAVRLTVAVLRDEGLQSITEQEHQNATDMSEEPGIHGRVNIVQWSEDCYETQLIERTINACEGNVDIIIDFAANPRSMNRSLKCLSKGGVIVIGAETAQRYVSRFESVAQASDQTIVPVEMGSLEQLHTLVHLIASKKVEPPPYNLFPSDKAEEVFMKLGRAKIHGRAILHFDPIPDAPET